MNVKVHKTISFNSFEKQSLRETINLLENLQEVLGEVDYDYIDNLIDIIEDLSHREWDFIEEEEE